MVAVESAWGPLWWCVNDRVQQRVQQGGIRGPDTPWHETGIFGLPIRPGVVVGGN